MIKVKIVHEVIHYVINTMETASLSVRPVLQHSLHNVIIITDERKSIQGSMSNKTLTQGIVLNFCLLSKIVFVNYFCVHGYSVSLVNVSCLNKTDWSLCFDFTEPACTIWLYITTRSLWNSWYRSEAFYSLWSKSKIVHEVIHYVINTMETASLSRAACPPLRD